MKNTNVTIRLDDELKEQAEELFADLGMSFSTAVNVFLRQCVRDQGIPFAVTRSARQTAKIEPVEELTDEPEESEDDSAEDPDYNPMAISSEDFYSQFGNFSSFMNAMNELGIKEE